MEGLTFLQLPGEAAIRLVSVSQPSTSTVVYETATTQVPHEPINEDNNEIALDASGTSTAPQTLTTESSNMTVLNKEQCSCLLCLQTIENTGAYKEVGSKSTKLSLADFCKLLNVTFCAKYTLHFVRNVCERL